MGWQKMYIGPKPTERIIVSKTQENFYILLATAFIIACYGFVAERNPDLPTSGTYGRHM